MADNRSEYTVLVGGVEHTMLLTDADAERYGENAKKSSGRKAAEPENKSRTVANKTK